MNFFLGILALICRMSLCIVGLHAWSRWEYNGHMLTIEHEFGGSSYGHCQVKKCLICGKAKRRVG